MFVLLVAAASWLCNADARAADPLDRYDDHGTAGLTRVSGQYLNRNYGYAVDLPRDLVGWMETAPAPNHGFNVYLGVKRSIEVDASHDSALLGSTAAVAEEVAGYVIGAHDEKYADKLDTKPAERVVQSWPGGDRRRVVVVRWQDEKSPGDAINFVLTLETTVTDYPVDKKTFDGIIKSFRFVSRSP